jgi:hypothetical protein|tara:strand:- start:5216 stop:5362 length:147 start_codon:yes stop_codon:yes gene_type:complete
MIKLIIDLLKTDDFYGVSRRIDIAKGRHKIPSTMKEAKDIIKRNWYGS